MAHKAGRKAKEGWEWLTPSGSTKWLSSDPSAAAEARTAAGKATHRAGRARAGEGPQESELPGRSGRRDGD